MPNPRTGLDVCDPARRNRVVGGRRDFEQISNEVAGAVPFRRTSGTGMMGRCKKGQEIENDRRV
jgi:hypothetical protein